MKQKESTRLSDYQRIVSYLYEYHHGIKGSNVGFAKIEKRQNRLRVYFHVKTNEQALEYKIYFYYFHQGAMNGIYLDTVKRNDAIIEFKNTYPLIDDFDKIDGFLLYYSNDHFFGSQWKDHPIIIRSFVPVESAENKNENTEKTVPPEPSPETETLSETEASPTSSLSEYIEALQLEKNAKDQIPDLDDNIKTNGFLLLNYGNFGHLMLAKDQDSGQRYLGIPGIFDNEKAFISRLFGFKTFITVPLKPHKTGNFGYFILPI